MGQNKLIVTGGYYIISLIFVAYLVSMLMQFLSNLGYPFKVPIKLHPGAVVESFMDLPAAMGVVIILARLCTLLTYTATYVVPNKENHYLINTGILDPERPRGSHGQTHLTIKNFRAMATVRPPPSAIKFVISTQGVYGIPNKMRINLRHRRVGWIQKGAVWGPWPQSHYSLLS